MKSTSKDRPHREAKGRLARSGGLLLASAALLLSPARALADAAAAATPFTVRLGGLRSDRGAVVCALYAGPAGFPTDPALAKQRVRTPIRAGRAIQRFAPIAPGVYAVACFHDENGNGQLDRNWLGIPKEGTVVSNHAKGTLGPPSFDAAKFAFDGRTTELALQMSY